MALNGVLKKLIKKAGLITFLLITMLLIESKI